MPTTLTTTQQEIQDMVERIEAARADGFDVRDLEAQLDYLERSATTAELRHEIERDYPEISPDRDRALAQLDVLNDAGIHRIERYDAQSPHVAVGDAYGALAREREQAAKDEVAAEVDREMAERKAKAEPTISAGHGRVPGVSYSAWSAKYDVKRDTATRDVVYSRDGVEHIRDRGEVIDVRNDPEAVKDAVKLCKEQGVEKIDVLSKDAEKRQMVMREAYRQGVAVETHRDPHVEAELKAAVKAVESERAGSRAEERDRENEAQRVNDGPEIEAEQA
jgi:hypothetical protein